MLVAKIRWRVAHDYRELKDGLSLDHFEGRSYLGWHRHVTLAALAQAFCTMLRLDPKSPCAGLTLYAVLRELQKILATWTGVCLIEVPWAFASSARFLRGASMGCSAPRSLVPWPTNTERAAPSRTGAPTRR
ncbi:hypothetical protein SAMN05442782_10877 [Streptomyces sp. OK228]|nr:hypothetical protein SAMN05442782_10877 [Streptomyces sp. OK228]